MKKKGFTLIELLVVMAIIGILASIVMVSMSGAGNKAKDARIKGDLSQVRNLAQLIDDDDGAYTNLCSGGDLNSGEDNYGGQLKIIQDDIDAQQGATGGASTTCWADADAYCVSAYLLSLGTGQVYCIDSNGIASETTSNGSCAAGIGCNNQGI